MRRVQLIRREIRESVPPAAVELLLSGADHVIEGGTELDRDPSAELRPGRSSGGAGAGRVYASLMTTIDLMASAKAFREPPDAATAQRVAELMADTDIVRQKLIARVRPHLAELAQTDPQSLEISLDFEIRVEGHHIFIDSDAVGVSSRSG